MLRNLELTRYYNTSIKRENGIDRRIRQIVNVDAQQKRIKILDFFRVPKNKISQTAMITLNKILDDSLYSHTKFKNHDKVNEMYTNDLLYVFCMSNPSIRNIATLQLYLEDASRHTQCNVSVLYNLLATFVANEEIEVELEFVSDDEEEIEEENDEIIEITI